MFANIYVMFANIKVMFANICDGLDVAQIMIFLLTYVREHYLMSICSRTSAVQVDMFANISSHSDIIGVFHGTGSRIHLVPIHTLRQELHFTTESEKQSQKKS